MAKKVIKKVKKTEKIKKSEKVEVQLSPPWVTYYNELRWSVGADEFVRVGPLLEVQNLYIVVLTVINNLEKAKALATIIKPVETFGEVSVNVVVVNEDLSGNSEQIAPVSCELVENPNDLADLVRVALSTNIYFEDIKLKSAIPGEPRSVYPIFKPSVIRFYNDDLSNYCEEFAGVASVVFRNVLLSSVCETAIVPSTACSGIGRR